MKRKKIIFISEKFVPDSVAIAIRMESFVRAIRDRENIDYSVITATRGVGSEYNSIQTFFSGTKNAQSAIVRLAGEILFGIEVAFRLLFIRYDLVVITSPPFFAGLIAAMGVRLRRKPYLLDIRDYYPEVLFDFGLANRDGVWGRFLMYLEKKWYKHAVAIGTVTENLHRMIAEKAEEKRKVHLIRNGFDEKIFKPSKEKYGEFTVAFHSNLGKYHNVDLLMQIIQEVYKIDSGIKFLIIGDGSEAYKIRESKLKNIDYRGAVAFAEIPELIAKAHLGLSLKQEGKIGETALPVKVYEFLGVEVPIINTPRGESGDMIENSKMGYQFSASELDEIVKIIVKISKNKRLQNDLRQNISKTRLQYSRKKASTNFVNLIRDLLG